MLNRKGIMPAAEAEYVRIKCTQYSADSAKFHIPGSKLSPILSLIFSPIFALIFSSILHWYYHCFFSPILPDSWCPDIFTEFLLIFWSLVHCLDNHAMRGFPGIQISREVKFPGKSIFPGSQMSQEVIFSKKLTKLTDGLTDSLRT